MAEYNAMTSNPPYTLGDVLKGKKTSYPHLDLVGDVGCVLDIVSGKPFAEYVVVRVYPDWETNEVLTVDMQLVEILDPAKMLPNPNAKCVIHGGGFPCHECSELRRLNY